MLFSRKILLDTNFLMIPGQFGVDIFEEISRIADFRYKLLIFDKTLKELEKLEKVGKQRDKMDARMAKKLIKVKKIGIIKEETDLDVDDFIVEYAKKNKIVVATQDAALKKRLKGTTIIVLKNKKYLSII